SSALLKRYVRAEPHSPRVRRFCALAAGNTTLTAQFTSVEIASALARKEREGTQSQAERDRLWRLFIRHWRSQYQIVPASEEVLARAEVLVFRHPLRAADAIHVATALVAAGRLSTTRVRFWTA